MKIFSSLLLGSLIVSIQAFASTNSPDVIYGADNRKDVFESHPAYIELARSTAAMMPLASLRQSGNLVEINAMTLQQAGVCAKERFSNQITAASCSGFLVHGNRLVTAGHCITSQADCSANKWVFDYKVESSRQGRIVVPATNVYSCKRILARKLETSGTQEDYAYIELDRPVADRHPVRFRRAGRVSVGDDLVVIGHPSGLPTKVADGAKVRTLQARHFTANLDTFGGNSGSAVFNIRTQEVEGILVRGENDYVADPSGCQVSNRCADGGCRGEDVTYITNVPGL